MRKNLPRKERNTEHEKQRKMKKKNLTSLKLTKMLQGNQDQTKIQDKIPIIGHKNQVKAERKMIERKEKQEVILRKINVRKGLKKINLTTSQKELATL
jgi:hypothetical protein